MTKPEPVLTNQDRYQATRRAGWVGVLVNLILACTKILFGFLSQSQSLVADGIHSLSDLATDAVILVAARHANREPDEDHPYGHGRFETVATTVLGLILIAVAAGIVIDAVHRIVNPEDLAIPGFLALAVAAFSILANEWLYQYTIRVARRVRSTMLKANAWHHRSDSVSSLVVVVGVGGTIAGIPYLDAVAAVGVGLMIVHIGWKLAWSSVRELVDTALDSDRVDAIRDAILAVDGVKAMHLLRTRNLGGQALADVHVLVDHPWCSVSEGHMISETVRAKIINEVDEIFDVTVHIDPEDDEKGSPSVNLPLRRQLLPQLQFRWAEVPEFRHHERIVLHYLRGSVDADVFISRHGINTLEQIGRLTEDLKCRVADMDYIGRVRVFFG